MTEGVVENRLAVLRKKEGITQRQLAERVGVSQPTIQRAEADKFGSTSYQLMHRIAVAMGVTVSRIWPSLLDKRAPHVHRDVAVSHTLKVKMKGIANPFLFPISAHDVDRMYGLIQNSDGFALFDSDGWVIALDLNKVQWINFLVDFSMGNLLQEESAAGRLQVWFDGDQTAQSFQCEPDSEVEESDEDDAEEGEVHGPLNYMLNLLESVVDLGPEPVFIVDEDGEEVYLNITQITVLRLDRALVDLALRAAQEAGDAEEAAELRGDGGLH